MMRYGIAIALVGVLTTSTDALVSWESPSLLASNVNVVDPVTFHPAPPVDVWGLSVTNGETQPVTSVSVRLNGPFVNNNSASGVTFKVGTGLPRIGPFPQADTFFVLPTGGLQNLVVTPGTIDSDGVLAAEFSTSDGSPLIPAGSSQILVAYSVPAGSPFVPLDEIVDCGCFKSGDEVLPGTIYLEISLLACPEPTTCVLAGLALVGAAARRRG